MTTNNHELGQQIENLVRDHIAMCRHAAAAAVERAFATASDEPVTARARTRRPSASPRRTPEEVMTLCERLHETVCAMPGETMAVLAPRVGASPRDLQLPAKRLKRTGRLRSVGQRQYTRYFPLAGDAPESA